LVRETSRKESSIRHRNRWEYILKIGMNYIYISQYRDLWGALVKSVIYLVGIQYIGKFLSGF
jgi:hypothetical protein